MNHCGIVLQEFLEYEVSNKIEMGYDRLQFPAVTLCNINPIRKSQLEFMSDDLRDFLNKTDLENVGNRINTVRSF